MKKAIEVLKTAQTFLENIINDVTRILHNLETISASLGYAIDLLVKQEEGR